MPSPSPLRGGSRRRRGDGVVAAVARRSILRSALAATPTPSGGCASHLPPKGGESAPMTSRYPAIAPDILALFAARGRRARRRAHHAAGRPVPRHGGRRSSPPHFPHRKRDRRSALPASRIHHSRLPRPHRHAGRTRRAATPISARCSASAARAATSSFRPASRISATATRPPPTPARWPTPMRC